MDEIVTELFTRGSHASSAGQAIDWLAFGAPPAKRAPVSYIGWIRLSHSAVSLI